MRLDEATSNVKKLAEKRFAEDKSANEFVEIVETDGFKIYATAGKIANAKENGSLHENPRDVFVLVIEGKKSSCLELKENDRQSRRILRLAKAS